jgi:hypothetical protein
MKAVALFYLKDVVKLTWFTTGVFQMFVKQIQQAIRQKT